ncbi:MAG: hypothetical protein BWK77_07710 [Verrucomicrobia bacterium A1]|nr:MAG: hypothetical protein BWK77_07710 [Verrucomicrobia bacterium A1]
MKANITDLDRALARICELCPVCRTARRHPEGAANAFVRRIEGRVCPFCRAYARVHGRPSHAPVPRVPKG